MNEDDSHPTIENSSWQEHHVGLARLVDLPPSGLVITVVVFFGLAAALSSIGGWAGIVAVLCLAVLCLAALGIAGVIVASDA